MKTLNELLNTLNNLRLTYGGEVLIVTDGWNDTGVIQRVSAKPVKISKTMFHEDGEVTRAWEITDTGVDAILINCEEPL
jgi:hypothetical protein